jgi:hypothetical protein
VFVDALESVEEMRALCAIGGVHKARTRSMPPRAHGYKLGGSQCSAVQRGAAEPSVIGGRGAPRPSSVVPLQPAHCPSSPGPNALPRPLVRAHLARAALAPMPCPPPRARPSCRWPTC